jgi:hypothetical protein
MGVESDGERCGCWYTDDRCYCADPSDDGLCYCVPDCHCCTADDIQSDEALYFTASAGMDTNTMRRHGRLRDHEG